MTTTAVPSADGPAAPSAVEHIQQTLALLIQPGEVFEVRAPQARERRTSPFQATVSGYFDHPDKAALAIACWSGQAPGLYLTINPTDPALLARANNKAIFKARHTTSDAEIIRRRTLLIDLDPGRPAGISSNVAEHDAAIAKARAIQAWLTIQGWPAPLVGDSGNGAHLLYRIDLPNNPESKVLVDACLKALAARFDDAQRQTQPVTVDTGVGNAARISKIYGTWVMKGDATPERPHRIARILSAPAMLETVTETRLAALAAQAPQQTAQRLYSAAPAAGHARSRVIDAFNQMHDCAAILERHGYRKHGPRWIAPGSSSGMPGITQLPDGRVYSHHSADPLNDGHAHDAFSLYATLEHGGDHRIAVKAAAALLGMTRKQTDTTPVRDAAAAPIARVPAAGSTAKEPALYGVLDPRAIVCVTDNPRDANVVHRITGMTVIAATDQQLYGATQALRQHHPRLRVLVCAPAITAATNPRHDQARAAYHALIGGAALVAPDFLHPSPAEIERAALDAGAQVNPNGIAREALEEAQQVLEARDRQRQAAMDPAPATFADLAAWPNGEERVKDQIGSAARRIGRVRLAPGKLPATTRQAENELIFSGLPVYQRAGMLVRPITLDAPKTGGGAQLPAGALVLQPADRYWLCWALAKAATWEQYDGRRKDWVIVDPPLRVADTYLALPGDWRVPVLTGIVECPTLREDGSLLLTSGYDPASGLYVDYRGEPVLPIENPTREDARAALETLKYPYGEFPFAEGDVDLAVVIAAILTAVIRRSLRTAPLFAFDAPVMGSGKGLIVNSIALIATGRVAPAISQGRDETEDEKRLGALLLQGVSLLNVDNIERDLHGNLLCSALTETTIAIRVLGQSQVFNLPARVAMFATGNNLRPRGDMVRRMLLCRIDPGVERPDTRKFSLNVKEYIVRRRARLLAAALTLLRAYIVAGKPKQDIEPYGSFEDWSDLVRSALVWLGMPDPNATRARLEAADTVTIHLRTILNLWHATLGDRCVTAAEVAQQAGWVEHIHLRAALIEVAASPRDPERVDAQRLGRWLGKYQGRVVDGLRLDKAGMNTDAKIFYWRVKKIQSTGDTGIPGIVSPPCVENA